MWIRSNITTEGIDRDLSELEDPFDRLRYLSEVLSLVNLGLTKTNVVRVDQDIGPYLINLQRAAIVGVMETTVTDVLTGMHTRNHIDAPKREPKDKYVVLMVDIDNFKRINDAYGHTVGDIVIKNVARVILRNLRESYVGRYGGEEFYVELERTDKEGGRVAAERLRRAVENEVLPYVLEELQKRGIVTNEYIKSEKITVSIGIADERQGEKPFNVRERADNALYFAKRFGRNRVVADGDDTLKSFNWRQIAVYHIADEIGTLGKLLTDAAIRMKTYLR